jgi:hypothetical protein
MIYLKTFETHQDTFYSVVTDYDLNKLSDNIKISERVKSTIKSRSSLRTVVKPGDFVIEIENFKRVDQTNLKFTSLNIYEFPDEWFIVSEYSQRTLQYYKCDQLEGLLKLLEDLNIIE